MQFYATTWMGLENMQSETNMLGSGQKDKYCRSVLILGTKKVE